MVIRVWILLLKQIVFFTTYVRPLLEYASSVWSPKSAGLIKTIDSVQRRFTASVPGCEHPTYIEILKMLHIDSVENADLRPTLPLHTKLSSD